MVFLLNEIAETDFQFLKNGGDDIIYLNTDFENLK